VRPHDTAPTLSQTRRGPAGTFFGLCHPLGRRRTRAQRRACTPALTAFVAGQDCGQHLIYDLGLPRDIC
jgi:hypothetical protein